MSSSLLPTRVADRGSLSLSLSLAECQLSRFLDVFTGLSSFAANRGIMKATNHSIPILRIMIADLHRIAETFHFLTASPIVVTSIFQLRCLSLHLSANFNAVKWWISSNPAELIIFLCLKSRRFELSYRSIALHTFKAQNHTEVFGDLSLPSKLRVFISWVAWHNSAAVCTASDQLLLRNRCKLSSGDSSTSTLMQTQQTDKKKIQRAFTTHTFYRLYSKIC